MAKLKEFFLRSPLPIRQAMVAAKGLEHRLTRYRKTYRDMLQLLAASEKWPKERMHAYQAEQLGQLLREAKNGTVHYGETLADLSDAQLDQAAAALDIRMLPILSKAKLKEKPSLLFNRQRKHFMSTSTSGTTGKSLKVSYDQESFERRFAFMHRQRIWARLRRFARTVQLTGRELVDASRRQPPYWMANPAENQLLVSTFHLTEGCLPAIVDKIVAFRPELIYGFPSALTPLARFCERTGMHMPSLVVALTTAETMEPDERTAIERGLGVQVYDFYSASEGVPFILECEAGGRHICPESGVFEILSNNGEPVDVGEVGELVVTSFVQWRTPLIRYRTGDMAVRAPDPFVEPCPCGRTLPRVDAIFGRREDMVVTRDGRCLGVFNDRVVKGMKGLLESQVVQTGLDDFEVRWVPDGGQDSAAVETEIQNRFRRVLGYDTNVKITRMERIPRDSSGKMRATVRKYRAG